jgi:hypothetical protein
MTMTGCMGPSLLKRSEKKMMKKKRKVEIENCTFQILEGPVTI